MTKYFDMSLQIIGEHVFPGNFLAAEAARSDRDGVIINLFDQDLDITAALGLPEAAAGIVVVSSTEVYGRDSGDSLTTDAEAVSDNRFLLAENRVKDECAHRGIPVVILRPVDMIGTAMTGRWRCIANGIYRATYHHIRNNNAMTSVVHAIDLAAIAVKAVGLSGTFNVTDGREYMVRDVAEALSNRFDHKRIPVFSLKQAKIEAIIADVFTLGAAGRRAALRKAQLSLTFDGSEILRLTRHQPIETLTYLKTHEYGSEDI